MPRTTNRVAVKMAQRRARNRLPKTPPNPSIFSGEHRAAKWFGSLERSLPVQVLAVSAAIIGFGAVLATLAVFQNDLRFRAEERENMRQDRIARLWDRVLRPAGGNIGKGRAITALHEMGEKLTDLDVSCLDWKRTRSCANKPIISNVYLSGDTDFDRESWDHYYDEQRKFSIDLRATRVEGAALRHARFHLNIADSTFVNSEFENGAFQLTAQQAVGAFVKGSLINSNVTMHGKFAISNTNVSGTTFVFTDGTEGIVEIAAVADYGIRATSNWNHVASPPKCDFEIIYGYRLPWEKIQLGKIAPCNFIRQYRHAQCARLTQSHKHILHRIFGEETRFEINRGRYCTSLPGFTPLSYHEALELFPFTMLGRYLPHP